jgi:hypothetical protein
MYATLFAIIWMRAYAIRSNFHRPFLRDVLIFGVRRVWR